ncbi:MAG: accessory Sec system protein Asp2 [Lachnospiraceae bacterium]
MAERPLSILEVGNFPEQDREVTAGVILHVRSQVPEDTGEAWDAVLTGRALSKEEVGILTKTALPHRVFYLDPALPGDSVTGPFLACKLAKYLAPEKLDTFLQSFAVRYFRKQYGERWALEEFRPNPAFVDHVRYLGHNRMVLSQQFGDGKTPVPVLTVRSFIRIWEEQPLDLWWEILAGAGVSFSVRVWQIEEGSLDTVDKIWDLSEEELSQPFCLCAKGRGTLAITLLAKGEGELLVGPLHTRYSREGAGVFFPGGQRLVGKDGREAAVYFEPGDVKPPLCVYFSGYRRAEGFEGLNMMRRMGAPILMFTDMALEGGAFYLGDPDFEESIRSAIRSTLESLHFSEDQLILSGISMGSSGAVYYGADFHPHALIVGKPLLNLGSIAANERLLRPGGFPTSLDILQRFAGSDGVEKLNHRVFDKVDKADWEGTEAAVSYMAQDDYDPTAYQDLLSHLRGKHATIYGKRITGRHNDNTNAVVEWFVSQYRRILREDFAR